MELSEYTELERVLKRSNYKYPSIHSLYHEKMIDYDHSMQEFFENSPPCLIPIEIISSLPDDPPEAIISIQAPKADLFESEIHVEREDNYKETYYESVAKTSTLTQSIMQDSKQSMRKSSEKPGNLIELTIYLFGTMDTIKVSIGINATIEQLISKVISVYMKNDMNKVKPLPKGPFVDGYQIWMIDEETCFPDTDITLDKNKMVRDLDTENLAFCAISGFRGVKVTNKATMVEGTSLFIQFNEKRVHFGAEPNLFLQDVLKILEKKFNVGYMNPSEYEFKIELELEDSIEKEECIVGMEMQICDLRTNDLKLYKKVYADMPAEVQTIKKEIPMSREDGEVRFDPSRTFLSRAQACLYKEYEVIKWNNKGKKQKRILGIDQQRVHNMTPEQARQLVKGKALKETDKKLFRKKLVSMFKAVTQHPEILVSNILNVDQDPKVLNSFSIEYTENNIRKKKIYETEKSSTSAEIVAKITMIMAL